MKSIRYFTFILTFILFALQFSHAQRSKFPTEAGLLLGASAYAGDIVKSGDYDYGIPGMAVGLFYRNYFTNNLNFRLGVIQSVLRGNDYRWENTDRIGRGFNFKTPITEISGKIEFDILNHRRRVGNNTFHRIVSPFFSVGGGLTLISPKTFYNPEQNPALSAAIAYDQENTPSLVWTIPLGAGIRYDLSEKILIGLEGTLNPVFNDYLDGISQSGEPANNDWYATVGLSLTYRFDKVLLRRLIFRR